MPADDRIFSFRIHDCVCKDLPQDFDGYSAWVVGGKRYYQMTTYLERCAKLGFDDLDKAK